MMADRLLVIPAAGRGSRLGAALPKVLVPVNGQPMLRHLLALYAPFVERAVVVVNPAAEHAVRGSLRDEPLPVIVALQEQPSGMLDAIRIGTDAARASAPERVWITWGDQIAVQHETLARLAALDASADVALPTVERTKPYTVVVRNADGRVTDILQRREGDVMPESGESEMGVFSLSRRAAFEWLDDYAAQAAPGRATAERNFLPFLAWASHVGTVMTCRACDPMEAVGINTPQELETVAAWLRTR